MNYRIVVDAGHGGDDPGAISGNLKEKDFTLKAANYMYDRFRQLGVPVTITRNTDRTLSRQERLNTMRSLGTDPNVIILSNHINAGSGEGAEVVYPLRSNENLARMILEEIGSEGQIMRKYYQRRLPEDPSKDYYYIMRETPNTTSLLLEYGFIDNKNDQVKLQNYLLNYVEAVVRAVSKYIGIPYTKPGGNLDNTYVVKRGDTLYSIARNFNTTVDRLKLLNNLTSNTLTVGQVLKLDEEVDISPDPNNGETYTVKPGDTLYKIASEFNTTVAELIDLNNLSSTILSTGQTLLIPNKSIDTTNTYIVKRGDNLINIAKMFNITVDDLITSNNLNSTVLQIGQVLTIPTGIMEDTNDNEEIIDYVTYQVLPGDTLYKIANAYNTTVDDIKTLNNLTSNTLSIGQILNIPNEVLMPSTQTYTVQRGDSLWLIANKLNTTVDELKRVNNLVTNIIQIGQVLLIP